MSGLIFYHCSEICIAHTHPLYPFYQLSSFITVKTCILEAVVKESDHEVKLTFLYSALSQSSISSLLGNKLTLDDIVCVLEEVLDLSADWYNLGLQLKVRIGTLESIQADFSAPKYQLQEMLKSWLTTGDNPSWKTLTAALRSRMVGASQLAAVIETKHCPVERTELDIGGHPETLFPPSPISEPITTVTSQHTDMQGNMRK